VPNEPGKIRVFVSSPSDVQLERDHITRVVNELNETITIVAPEKSISLELIKWETHVAPGLHAQGPQGVVTDQIPEYDIFVGIMWKRFGTPTQHFGSGTEEEFRDAYARWEKTRKTPRIMFYFCQADLGYFEQKEALNQFEKVLAFRKELNDKGLMQSYTDRSNFDQTIRHQLNLVLAPMFAGRTPANEIAQRVGGIALANDASVRGRIFDLAQAYVHTRKTMEPSDERTRRMEVLISQMRTLAFTAYPLLSELTQSIPQDQGRDARAGERLAAVALLQAMPHPDYIEWLAGRLGEERPFLGYHAAVALLTAARSLGSATHGRLKAAIEYAIRTIRYVPEDADRKRILGDALSELSASDPRA
jgi:hypothetical protein